MEATDRSIDRRPAWCPRCGAATDDPGAVCDHRPTDRRALPIGTRLREDRYEIHGVVDRDASTIRYVALDRRLDRPVDLVELAPDGIARRSGRLLIPPRDAARFEELVQRFTERARALSRIHDPGIARVHALFRDHGTVNLVTEHVEGPTLADIRRRRNAPFPDEALADVAIRLARALRRAHAIDVVHGALRPDVVVSVPAGRLVLTRFDLTSSGADADRDGRRDADRQALAALLLRLAPVGDDGPPSPLVTAIRGLLDPDPTRRPRDLDELLDRLDLVRPSTPQLGPSLEMLRPVEDGRGDPARLLMFDPVSEPMTPPGTPTDSVGTDGIDTGGTAAGSIGATTVGSASTPDATTPWTGTAGDVDDPTTPWGETGREAGDPMAPRGVTGRAVDDPTEAGDRSRSRGAALDATVVGDSGREGSEAATDRSAPSAHPLMSRTNRADRLFTWPLVVAVLLLGGAAPVVMTAALVGLVLPLLATIGDRRADRSDPGRRATGVRRWPPVRLVRNLLVGSLLAVPGILLLVLLLVSLDAVGSVGAASTGEEGLLRVGGAVVALALIIGRSRPSTRYRTRDGLDATWEVVRPTGRIGERLIALWLVLLALSVLALLLEPTAFPIGR